jgi:hypothetical protein
MTTPGKGLGLTPNAIKTGNASTPPAGSSSTPPPANEDKPVVRTARPRGYEGKAVGQVYLDQTFHLTLSVWLKASRRSFNQFGNEALTALYDMQNTTPGHRPSPETLDLVRAFIARTPELQTLPPPAK